MKFIKRGYGEFIKFDLKRSRVQETVYHMTFLMRFYGLHILFIDIVTDL